MGYNYGTNKAAGIGAGTASNGLGGVGLARMLGMAGAAISPKDSWQQRLGAASAEMAKNEQGRRYLAELLASQNEAKEGESEKSSKDGEKKDSWSSELSKNRSDILSSRGMDLSLPGIGLPEEGASISEENLLPYALKDLVDKLKSQYGGG